ncbi:serine hydrolase [Hoeflea sp. YIM 152468]|uniref:serine hydrolase domain-containing protein n=1 Tax=Hoeflea sp. YIM 152468 TaxID=3031759 RepID=UPI0023DAC78D|nr:serine hydrolase [Hoeflea sp. YIM 152468]MDF1609795.1 serine hydrolase [Hoeflea sp. YIM 152468]
MPKSTEFEAVNGFPREAVTLANWRTRPYSFWSFRNVAEMVRSARIKTADATSLPKLVDNPDLLGRPAAAGLRHSIADLLGHSQVDSFLLSRQGRIVCEWHAKGIDRTDPHLIFSIAKSITALVAGMLEDQGILDPSAPIGELVPETRNSAFADATVQHLLDMRVSLDFDESYLSEEDYARYRRAMSWNPPSGKDEAMLSFLCSLRKASGPHGTDHWYLSPNSDLLGIVLERVSGERFTDLCSRLLWQPLGASADAYVTVDPQGAPRTAGGISCRPHDLLALGQMLINGGTVNGNRIVSQRWIDDMQKNGDSEAWARGTQADFLKTGRYRNNWYQVGGGSNAYLAAGIHGQFLYCDPATDTVIACTSSQSEPQNDALDQGLLAMFTQLSAGD